MVSTKHIILAVSLIVVTGAAGYFALNFKKAGDAPAQNGGGGGGMAVAVEAQSPVIGSIDRSIQAVGTLISDESVVLSPELAGRVATVSFAEGDRVSAGQPLIRLDDSVNKAELAEAEASLALSIANYNRADRLFKSGNGTERARDESLSAMNVDRARVNLAKARLDKMEIKAPFNGVVGLRNVSMGDYVTPGQALTNVEKIDVLKVDFRVPEIYLASLKTGQEIDLRVDAFPDRAFKGVVYAIDPKIDESGRSIVLRARMDNAGLTLRPGLFARVNLIVEQRNAVLTIPEQSLWPQGDRQFVYVITDNKPVLTEVETGLRKNGMVEIKSGLNASDTVITAGQMKIRPNSSVTVVPTNAAAGGEASGESQ